MNRSADHISDLRRVRVHASHVEWALALRPAVPGGSTASGTVHAAPARPTPAPSQERMYDCLARLEGKRFDRQYVTHMMDDHRKAVSLFQQQAKRCQDPDLNAFAQKTLPTLRDHLAMSRKLHAQRP